MKRIKIAYFLNLLFTPRAQTRQTVIIRVGSSFHFLLYDTYPNIHCLKKKKSMFHCLFLFFPEFPIFDKLCFLKKMLCHLLCKLLCMLIKLCLSLNATILLESAKGFAD